MSEVRHPRPVQVSPSELLQSLLLTEMDENLCPHVVVGPATDDQQKAGVVSIVDAGLAKQEMYLSLSWPRHQLRCLAKTLEHADRISRQAYELLGQRGRTVVQSPSTGERFLLHHVDVAGGPSMHYDTPDTWETLLYTETLLGLQPVS